MERAGGLVTLVYKPFCNELLTNTNTLKYCGSAWASWHFPRSSQSCRTVDRWFGAHICTAQGFSLQQTNQYHGESTSQERVKKKSDDRLTYADYYKSNWRENLWSIWLMMFVSSTRQRLNIRFSAQSSSLHEYFCYVKMLSVW